MIEFSESPEDSIRITASPVSQIVRQEAAINTAEWPDGCTCRVVGFGPLSGDRHYIEYEVVRKDPQSAC